MKTLTETQKKALEQVCQFNSTETMGVEMIDNSNDTYAIYVRFNGETTVGFTDFETSLTYLAGYQMQRKLFKEEK